MNTTINSNTKLFVTLLNIETNIPRPAFWELTYEWAEGVATDLKFDKVSVNSIHHNKPQHLYAISDRKIAMGDVVASTLHKEGFNLQHVGSHKMADLYNQTSHYHPIVATTNEEVMLRNENIAKIGVDFLTEYITANGLKKAIFDTKTGSLSVAKLRYSRDEVEQLLTAMADEFDLLKSSANTAKYNKFVQDYLY